MTNAHTGILFFLGFLAASQGAEGLVPLYEVTLKNGQVQFATSSQTGKPNPAVIRESVPFRAVVHPLAPWPNGLIPIFGVERKGRYELRRRPPIGKEKLIEPLFFARPPVQDTNALRISGRWEVTAVHEDGQSDVFSWEFAFETNVLTGRFDQNTDYRFAYVTDGSFVSNRIRFQVDYIQQHYALSGQWRKGALSGTFQQMGDIDKGTWSAVRPNEETPVAPRDPASLTLYEWRRGNQRRYAAHPPTQPGWKRAPHPLCRVWEATKGNPVP